MRRSPLLRSCMCLIQCSASGNSKYLQAVSRSPNVMKDLPLSKVYQLLEPGPVVLLATVRRGRANIMTMSWHMMVEFEPPLVACVVSNANHSFAALRATKECVIAIPTQRLAPKVVQTGTLLLPLNLHDHTSSTSAAQAVVRLNHLKLGLLRL